MSSNQSGVEGFDDKMGGKAMADRHDTSSFDAQPERQKKVHINLCIDAGLEEGGRMRQPNTGIVGRNDARFTESQMPPSRLDLMKNLQINR